MSLYHSHPCNLGTNPVKKFRITVTSTVGAYASAVLASATGVTVAFGVKNSGDFQLIFSNVGAISLDSVNNVQSSGVEPTIAVTEDSQSPLTKKFTVTTGSASGAGTMTIYGTILE